MLLKPNFFRLILSFCLILSVSVIAFADTIRLKDGSIIKGRIVNFRDGQFIVLIGDGSRARQMTFFSDEIDAIEFDAGTAALSNVAPAANPVLPVAPPPPAPTAAATPNNTRETGDNPDNVKIIVGQGSGNAPVNPPVNSSANAPRPSNTDNATAANRPTYTPPNTNTNQINTPTNQTNTQPSNAANATRPKPIQLNLTVLADNTANGWTNAGWVVKKGQRIRITGTGRISLGKGNYSTPAGNSSLADKDKLVQKEATGGLIAVVGDDNNDFVFIGNSREFTASRDGALFLGINEGVLDDNSGSFDVVVEIDPGVSN